MNTPYTRRRSPRRKPRAGRGGIPDADQLEQAALAYLARYPASVAMTRQMLQRLIARRARAAAATDDGTPASPPSQAPDDDIAITVEGILSRFVQAGYLNDRTYAEGQARRLRRRGCSRRAAKAWLLGKGVADDLVDAVLDDPEGRGEDAGKDGGEAVDFDIAAALAYARRRRFGPWRTPLSTDMDDDADADADAILQAKHAVRKRELAALGRQGFSFSLARMIVDAEAISDLSEALEIPIPH